MRITTTTSTSNTITNTNTTNSLYSLNIKLDFLIKGQYDIGDMKMDILAHTDYPIWEVIQNGNGLWLYCIIFQLAKCRAFVSENTSSTNDVSTAYGVSNTSGHNSKHEQTSSYSLLASQSSCPQLDHEDLDQVDEYDLEEMDLKWQVAMISMRIKKFYKKTGRKHHPLQFDAKEPVGFDKTKVECYNCHKTGHFARECRTKEDNRRRDGWNPGNKDGSRTGKKEESKALVTVDGESVDWTTHSEVMKILLSCDASVEIKAYTQGLKKVEATFVCPINRYESDSDDEYVSVQTKGLNTPSFANKQVKTPRENVKNQSTTLSKPIRLSKEQRYLRKIFSKPISLSSKVKEVSTVGENGTTAVKYHQQVAHDREQGLPAVFQTLIVALLPLEGGQHFHSLFCVTKCSFGDKKNKVLFTDTECLILSPDFKLPDENQILLKVPRQNNMYSFNLENIVPLGGLACLIAKATTDESNLWHRRLGHVNFKNLNRLVKGNLVRGLPTKLFQNDHTCVACQKGKQHKASCKAKLVSSISHTLQLLHMDLFGPTSVRSINHKTYCLVITDDFSRFSWTFFLRTKDETSAILKDFIRQIENQLNQKVKTIRCDNGTEFKNRDIIEFCGLKGIKREYSNARTPQQNGVAERKNRTLIEAARTMLADSFLPNTFWAEAVSTACYVLNRVLVTKPHNKTPYELLTGKTPIISYIRPFGCHVTILNTIDHLGKFAGKSDEGFLVGYSLQSKAFRVYNLVTKRVEENLHINFLENKPNVAGIGPNWLFDLDYLTDSMNYHNDSEENQANLHAGQQESKQDSGTKDKIDSGNSQIEDETDQDCFELPIWHSYSSTNKSSSKSDGKRGSPREEEQIFLDDLARLQIQEKEANEEAEALRKNLDQETEILVTQGGAAKSSSTNNFNTVSTLAQQLMLVKSSYDDEGAEADSQMWKTVVNVIGDSKSLDPSNLPYEGSKAIGSKWVYDNSKDERGWLSGTKLCYQMDVKVPYSMARLMKSVLTASTMRLRKPFSQVEGANDVDVHLYRSYDWLLNIGDYAGANVKEYLQPEVVNFLAGDSLLGNAKKANHCGHFYYRSRICCCCKLCGKFYGFQNQNVRLWVSTSGTKAKLHLCLIFVGQHQLEVGCFLERLSDEKTITLLASHSDVPNESLPDSSSDKPSELKCQWNTENAQSEGRTREMVDEDKEFDEVRLSTEDVVSTDKEGVSTDFEKVSTDRPIVSTDGSKVSTDEQREGTERSYEVY
ncbi:putative ribonuclease H-like domain-containing protein [Tanacetum coccineum]